jgi:hypothetical protein
MTRLRIPSTDIVIVLALFAVSVGASYLAMKTFRAKGVQPSFYQGNFEPAVMMACGRGFVTATASTIPPSLLEFLQLKRNTFDCSLLPAGLPRAEVTWNAPWYYLYGTTAAFWRLSGISWTSLDALVSLMAGVVTVALYGLFRFVAGPSIAAVVTLLLTFSPANLTYLLSMRDYSKAPFVLLSVLILATLVVRPLGTAPTLVLAAVYGAVVGFGWGFRSDLTVMVPFGVLVVLLLLPGSVKANFTRNAAAAVLLLAVFLVVAWPALRGLRLGGCQFHYALLGLTSPLTDGLGMTPSIYRFGGHFLDTFVDLKVGDYAARVLNAPVPNLCSPAYDKASGGLFMQMATTFPADLVAHAYGSVLIILRAGFAVPALMNPSQPFPESARVAGLYEALNHVTEFIAPLGPGVMLAAIATAWAMSARLGAALSIFALFLTAYPAIEFEGRHWFHLRFIPWWGALLVGGYIVRHGARGWTRPARIRAAAGVAAVLFALVALLLAVRVVQTRMARALIANYEVAATADVPFDRRDGSFVDVHWQPRDYASPPAHRASDLLVVTLDAANCHGTGRLGLRTVYDVDLKSHDMSSEFALDRPAAGARPTRMFIPVFWQGFQDQNYLRFSGLQVSGAPSACVGRVARVVDDKSMPLRIELQLPADWPEQRLYQTLRMPAVVRRMMAGTL